MKIIFLLIFLPIFSFAQTKFEMPQGLWVKVKAEMKDGSRIVDHYGCGMSFLKYNFTGNGLVNLSEDVLFDNFKVQCYLHGDTLQIGQNIFNVVGQTKDTLKLAYFIPGAEDTQIPVYYFAKVQENTALVKPAFDAALKDSVYQASNELFPQCKGRLDNLMAAIEVKYDKGTLKASFIIDKKGRVKNFTVLEMDSVSKGYVRAVSSGFSYLEWMPAKKNNIPVNSLVQVTLKSDNMAYSSRGSMNSLRVSYPFLTKPIYGKDIDKDELEAAQQFFKAAIDQVNSGNNQKAIELLGKCIEIDSIELNAYYLRAMINARLGNNKEACKDWSYLAGLGQVDAIQKLAKYCKN